MARRGRGRLARPDLCRRGVAQPPCAGRRRRDSRASRVGRRRAGFRGRRAARRRPRPPHPSRRGGGRRSPPRRRRRPRGLRPGARRRPGSGRAHPLRGRSVDGGRRDLASGARVDLGPPRPVRRCAAAHRPDPLRRTAGPRRAVRGQRRVVARGRRRIPPRRRPGARRRRFRRRSMARQSRAASGVRSGYRRRRSDSAPPVRGAARGVRSLALGSPVVGAGQAAVRRRGRGGFGQSARAPRLDRRRDDGGSRRPSPPLRARRIGGGRPAIRRDFRHRGQSRHHDGFGFGVLRLRPTPGVRAGAAGGPAGRRRLSAARRAGALRDRRADIRCAGHPGDRRSERGPRRDARCTHRRRAGRRRVHAPRGADR